MTAPARVAALDGLRGFAVLLVFCVHAAGNVGSVVLHDDFGITSYAALATWQEHLMFWVFRSHHGVFLFFALSGYLIARMWWPRPRVDAGTFVARRTLRIYPAFVLAFVLSLAFAYVSGTWTPPDTARVIGNLFFLNGWPPARVAPLNIVTWSLFYEMTFYLAFPLVALAARPLGALPTCAIGVALPVVASLAGADPIVLCWALLFGGAALAADTRVLATCQRVPAVVVALVYFAITTSAMLDILHPLAGMVAFGAAAMLLLAHCLRGGGSVAGIFSWRPLRALGRISYSFYLLHWMAVVLAARLTVAAGLGPRASVLAIFAGGFVLSLCAAMLSWWLVERPYFLQSTVRTAAPQAN